MTLNKNEEGKSKLLTKIITPIHHPQTALKTLVQSTQTFKKIENTLKKQHIVVFSCASQSTYTTLRTAIKKKAH